MDRNQRLQEVGRLAKELKRPIPVLRFIRQRIVQEEVVDAYQSLVPSGIQTKLGVRQVEKGNWVVIHEDGSQDTYTTEEFFDIYEPTKKSGG